MGAAAGNALTASTDLIVSFLDNWSTIAHAGVDGNDIANLADAEYILRNPTIVYCQSLEWDSTCIDRRNAIPVIMDEIWSVHC